MATTHKELDERLRDAIRASALAKHEIFLMGLARPVFHCERVDGPPSAGGSKLCGVADLPEGLAWPEHDHGPYEFIMQIDLAELGGADAGLPADGLLSVFAATDPPEAYFWQDPEYVHIVYTPAATPVVPTPPPPPSDAQRKVIEENEADIVRLRERLGPDAVPVRSYPLRGEGVALRFHRGLDLPRSSDQVKDWPLGEYSDWSTRSAFLDEVDGVVQDVFPFCRRSADDHVLGYPAVSSLAYDPTPEGDWLPLIGLYSHEDLGWCWHDGDYVHIAIERAKLAEADFHITASDAG